MELRPFGPDDLEAVEAFVAIDNAAERLDAPWTPPATVYRRRMTMRHGWDGDTWPHYLAYADGEPVGLLVVRTSTWDNPDQAWLHLVIEPGRRRRGNGRALMAAAVEVCRGMGRSLVGVGAWESDRVRRFAAALGLEQKSLSVNRRQHLAELPSGLVDDLHAEASAQARDYVLERLPGRTPDALLEELSVVAASINDAPQDDLEMEDEDYSPAHLRAVEDTLERSGYRFYRVLARHRLTGEVAGHTVVEVDAEQPGFGAQEDTAVARKHRGHRLGLLLKAEMVRWLTGQDTPEPDLRVLDTWNAESNDHMVAINERLGYRAMGRVLEYQQRA